MRNYFEFLMKQFLTCGRSCNPNNTPVFDKIEEKQVKLEFRKILDKLVINIIKNSLENEILLQALLELARIVRIIIVLHFLCGMKLSEIAYLLKTDLNSIYVQKYIDVTAAFAVLYI